MKKLIFELTLVIILGLFSNKISAQNETGETGKITGTVITDDNKVAEGVTVNIVGTVKNVVTDELVKFSFTKLTTGENTFFKNFVGWAMTSRKKVAVLNGKTPKVDFKLSWQRIHTLLK